MVIKIPFENYRGPPRSEEEERTIAVASAMERYGGAFIEALGKTLMVANAVEVRKIKEAFHREWNEYAALAGIEA